MTAEIMGDLLSFEADKRAINITLNSIGTELTREDRRKLYCGFGLLYPHGHFALAQAEDQDSVRAAVERVPQYRDFFQGNAGFGGESQMLEKVRGRDLGGRGGRERQRGDLCCFLDSVSAQGTGIQRARTALHVLLICAAHLQSHCPGCCPPGTQDPFP